MKNFSVLFTSVIVLTQFVWGQTTIVNYDFNAGTSYATLAPTVAPNITCSMTSSNMTYSRTGTGQASINAFTANATAGTPLVSGTTASQYWQFTLGGSALSSYKGYMIHMEHQISAAGTRTLQLSYSTNGTTWTNVGGAVGVIAAYVQQDWDLGAITALNGSAAVYFRLTMGGTGTTTVRIDNFQILAFNAPASPAGYYRSKASGDWAIAGTWEYSSDNGTWADATGAPGPNAILVTVRSGHTVSISGTTVAVQQQLVVEAGATIEMARNGGYIPTATWDIASTLLITGEADVNPFYGDQSFGNITINAPSMTSSNAALGNNNISSLLVRGTLTIANTGDTFYSQFPVTVTIGNLVISGGIFQLVGGGTARTLNITGDFTLSGGTFDPARGNASQIATINLSGNYAQTAGNIAVSATNGSADVNFNFAGSAVQMFSKTTGTISCVSGPLLTFTINNGAKVDFGTSVLNNTGGSAAAVLFTLASGGTLITGHTAGLATGAAGTIQVGGTRTYNTAGNFVYDGAAPQSTGNALPATVNGLTINNAAGVALTQNVTVSGALTLTGGILTTTATKMLTVAAAAAVSGAGDASFVSGPMKQTWTGATAGKLFPLGKSTYEPLTLALTSPSSPVIQAEVFDGNTGGTWNSPLTLLSTAHYYQMTLSSGTATNAANAVTIPNNNDIVGLASLLTVAKSGTVAGAYTKLSGANTGTNLVVTCAGYTAASGFIVLGTSDASLPVELTSFTAASGRNGIELKWSTATEVNNAGFDIERRSAASAWQRLGFVAGSGSSNVQHSYSFVDAAAGEGLYTYRLKQVDRDGGFAYSSEVTAAVAVTPAQFELGQNYPNPFNPSTTIAFALPKDGMVTLTVYDMLGRVVATLVNDVMQAGRHEAKFDASAMSSGTYLYRLQAGEFSTVKKFSLLK